MSYSSSCWLWEEVRLPYKARSFLTSLYFNSIHYDSVTRPTAFNTECRSYQVPSPSSTCREQPQWVKETLFWQLFDGSTEYPCVYFQTIAKVDQLICEINNSMESSWLTGFVLLGYGRPGQHRFFFFFQWLGRFIGCNIIWYSVSRHNDAARVKVLLWLAEIPSIQTEKVGKKERNSQQTLQPSLLIHSKM